jgi:glycosyltransferase involved in cell wall biosynthesis
MPSVSVVIPTIGRPTLGAAVESVRRQSALPDEIVVVNDSPEQGSVSSELGVDIVEEFTGGCRGASAARNIGVDRAQGELVAYLDDDDLWFPHHIASALQWFARTPELDLYACTMIQAETNGLRKGSKVAFRGREDLIDFFYGRFCWMGRRRSIPTPTWVFRRRVGALRMDETLATREDIWFLLNLEKDGRVLRQSARPGGMWFWDPDRTEGRDAADVLIDWAERIESLRYGAGQRFIIGVKGREYARKGLANEWIELVGKMPREWRISWDYKVIAAIESIALRRQRKSEMDGL